MGLTLEAQKSLRALSEKFNKEFGKIAQKLLALAFMDLGYELVEERSVQGVDIDVIKKDTGDRLSMEVKTTQSNDFSLEAKDVEGLKSRQTDGYNTFFAVLSLPHCLSEGWIIFPAQGIKPGKYNFLRLTTRRQHHISSQINEVFPTVLERVEEGLLGCERGFALKYLKERHNI